MTTRAILTGTAMVVAACAAFAFEPVPPSAGLVADLPTASWNHRSAKDLGKALAEARKKPLEPITAKKMPPPSGDKRDYVSYGPYWFPDPASSNGLPYIRRDGVINKELRSQGDDGRLGRFTTSVMELSAAAYRLGDHEAGCEAAARIRAFLLSPETGMRPNFDFAQAIPGRCTGRGTGLIDLLQFAMYVPDSILLVKAAGDLPVEDFAAAQRWFSQFLDWLENSKNGKDELKARNNHGSAFDIEYIVFALFTGQRERALLHLRGVPERRIKVQIEPDGRQPFELVRTKALGYSSYNLSMLLTLAWLGERNGVDVWGYRTPDGRSIAAAYDFLVPYWKDPSKWPYKQIVKFGTPSSIITEIHDHFAGKKQN